MKITLSLVSMILAFQLPTASWALEELATLKTNFEHFILEIESPQKESLRLTSEDGRVHLPPGEYLWTDYTLTMRDDEGKMWKFSCGTIMKEPFHVMKGENRLELCLPLRQSITARVKGGVVTFDEQLKGRSGENVYVYLEDKRIPPPAFVVKDPNGNQLKEDKFKSG